MEDLRTFSLFLSAFIIVGASAAHFGSLFSKLKLPLITGFLFTGIIAGPDILGIITRDALPKLRFIDDFSLALIAFAAGSELYLKELKSRLKPIAWITFFQLAFTFIFGAGAVYLLVDYIPFMADMSQAAKLAVTLLAGSILVARSPSSAIAIIKELRARGQFTQTMLGVTVIKDVLVIAIFTVTFVVAAGLINKTNLDIMFVFKLIAELLASIAIGIALALFFGFVLARNNMSGNVKTMIISLTGYVIFVGTHLLGSWTLENHGTKIHLEPLLICMVSGFYVANFTSMRQELTHALHRIETPVYVAFFTYTGASLLLGVIPKVWDVALALFAIRIFAVFLACLVGGTIAKDPKKHNLLGWMSYITQAGVGLGLAKQVAIAYPDWGGEFSTLLISVIVMNQIVGPPLLKAVLFMVGEAHPKAQKSDDDVDHSTIIIGEGGMAFSLAQQLKSHGWRVKVARQQAAPVDKISNTDGIQIEEVKDYTIDELERIGADHCGVIVLLLRSDERNTQIAELAFEHFSQANVVSIVNERVNCEKFHELGVFTVTPSTALVSLLDHYVRSPSVVSLMLGAVDDHDIIDIEFANPYYEGELLTSIELPDDVTFLMFKRKGKLLHVHNYYRPRMDDVITVTGTDQSLAELEEMFGR